MKNNNVYWKLIILLTAALVVTSIPRISFSASSDNYQVPESFFSGGGGEMSSETYTTVSTHGHPISGIEMASANFSVSSGFVATVLPVIEAAIDIDPDTLNLKSCGRWITCYITLPEEYPTDTFDPTAVALTRVNRETLASFIFSDLAAVHQPGDCKNKKDMLKVKFVRSEVQDVVPLGEVELTVTGNLLNGASFQGADLIRVIEPGCREGKSGGKKGKNN